MVALGQAATPEKCKHSIKKILNTATADIHRSLLRFLNIVTSFVM